MARLQPDVPGLPPWQQKELREQTKADRRVETRRPAATAHSLGLPDRFAPMPVSADRTPRVTRLVQRPLSLWFGP